MKVKVNFVARFCGATFQTYRRKDSSDGQFFSVNVIQDGGQAGTLACDENTYDKLMNGEFEQFEEVLFIAEYNTQYKSFRIVDVSLAD